MSVIFTAAILMMIAAVVAVLWLAARMALRRVLDRRLRRQAAQLHDAMAKDEAAVPVA